MKYQIEKNDSKWYELDFSIKYFEKLSEKDQEKIYKILRILSSLGKDEIEEETDKDYRFFTENENNSLSEIIKEVAIKTEKPHKKQ